MKQAGTTFLAPSFGMITLSEIEERIYVLTQTKSGEEF